MRIICLIVFLEILLVCQASASNITVIGKHIYINGTDTFSTTAYNICSRSDTYASHTSICGTVNMSNFTIDMVDFDYYPAVGWFNTLPTYLSSPNTWWTVRNTDNYNTNVNLSYTYQQHGRFFGYMQKDEPSGSGNYTVQKMKDAYNFTKVNDSAHPVILNDWHNLEDSVDAADIISMDYYTHIVNSTNPNNPWNVNYSVLAYDLYEYIAFYAGMMPNATTKPLWHIIQAYGDTVAVPGRTDQNFTNMEENEIRATVYAALSADINGIGFYFFRGQATNTFDLARNQTMFWRYQNISGEIRYLNDILLLPTDAHSWYGQKDNTSVSFSPNPTTAIEGLAVNNLGYILKNDSANNTLYLLMVNKHNESSALTTINIASLSGKNRSVSHLDNLGLSEVSNTSLVNGVFTDTFGAYDAHIYKISEEITNATADTFDVWLDNVDLGADTTNLFYNFTALAPNTTYNISIRTHNLTYDSYSTWVNQTTITNASVFIPPAPVWVSNNTGYYWANHTWQAGAGNGTDSYNISVNGTWYNGTSTSFNSSLLPLNWSNITVWAWNNTGYMSATNITNNSRAPASPSYIPPVPTWVSNITGSYWVNHTWSAGSGNITNSYNVSVNGTWYNSTATFFNSSLVPAGCSNITVWAYNNTGVTSATNITNNSCVPASPTYAPSITSYSPVDLTPSYSIGALATFEAGSNQSVSWTWTGATEGAGDGTTNSTATQTWLTAGAKTVTVTCSNANGSCGTIQWDVTVDPDPAAGYNISGYVTYVNTSPVEGARIRVWGAENTSDVNGYYALYGLSSGNYTILFEKDYYYDGVARIVLTDNATQNYTFVSKVHVSTPGFTGILALLGILLTIALYRHRNH